MIDRGSGRAGAEDVAIANDRPTEVAARIVMTFLGWLQVADRALRGHPHK